MPETEPEITEIAAFFAQNLPNEAGASADEATEAWRRALRYARSTGAIEELAEKVAETNPADPELQRRCVDVQT